MTSAVRVRQGPLTAGEVGRALPANVAGLLVGDVAAFVLGLLAAFEVRVVGRLYLGEAVLAVLALALPFVLRRMHDRQPQQWLKGFLWTAAVYGAVLVATDIYRGTPPGDFGRGWVRALLLITNTLGLLAVGWGRLSRLTYWVAGQALGSLGLLAVAGDLTIEKWKFGASVPVTALLLCCTDMRRPRVAYGVLLAATVLHLLLDYRSLAAFCLGTMLLLLVAKRRAERGGRLVDPLVLGVGLATAGLFALVYAANVSLTQAGEDLADRRAGSNIERYAGFVVGAEVISRSPFIGYGSWPKNDEVFSEWAQLQEDLGSALSASTLVENSEDKGEDGLIKTHSQFLQGWVEAGLPGALFFLLLFSGLARLLWRLVHEGRIEGAIALPIFWGLWTLWALLFSPFSGAVRLQNALSLVLAFLYSNATLAMTRHRFAGGVGA